MKKYKVTIGVEFESTAVDYFIEASSEDDAYLIAQDLAVSDCHNPVVSNVEIISVKETY